MANRNALRFFSLSSLVSSVHTKDGCWWSGFHWKGIQPSMESSSFSDRVGARFTNNSFTQTHSIQWTYVLIGVARMQPEWQSNRAQLTNRPLCWSYRKWNRCRHAATIHLKNRPFSLSSLSYSLNASNTKWDSRDSSDSSAHNTRDTWYFRIVHPKNRFFQSILHEFFAVLSLSLFFSENKISKSDKNQFNDDSGGFRKAKKNIQNTQSNNKTKMNEKKIGINRHNKMRLRWFWIARARWRCVVDGTLSPLTVR